MRTSRNEVCSLAAASYEPKTSKVKSSVTWLVGFSHSVSKSGHSHAVDMCNLFTEDEELSVAAADFLISGLPYRDILFYTFSERAPSGSFDGILQILCRNRMYYMNNEEFPLAPQQLEFIPICMDAHLQLIDMLMLAVSSKVWACVDNVVNSVRQISTFSASKELPNDVEDGVILWLKKVVQKVQHLDEVSSGQLTSEVKTFPVLSRNLDDFCDSCVLAVVLHYYFPQRISLSENVIDAEHSLYACSDERKANLKTKETPSQEITLNETMSIADSLHNLKLSLGFCYEELLFIHHEKLIKNFLKPDDFIFCDEELRSNFIAFYAFLFYCLEVKPNSVGANVKGLKARKAGVHQLPDDTINSPIITPPSLSDPSKTPKIPPEVKSLISDATKRSFLPRGATASSVSSFQTTTTDDSSDVSSQSAVNTIPHAPLLPRRHPDDYPLVKETPVFSPGIVNGQAIQSSRITSDISNGFGDETHDRAKWKTKVQPFYHASPSDLNSSTDSSVSQSVSSKHHLYRPVSASTTLLSKVDVDDSTDLSDILSGRTYNIEVPELDGSANLAWSGFEPGRFNPLNHVGDSTTSSSCTYDQDDLKLETVRTLEGHSPKAKTSPKGPSHFEARSFSYSASVVTDSSSDLTVITSDLAASGDMSSSTSKSSTADVESGTLSHVSKDSPSKSSTHPRNPETLKTNQNLQTSYTVKSQNFSSVDSAMAAGYPVITRSVDFNNIVQVYPETSSKQPVNYANAQGDVPASTTINQLSGVALQRVEKAATKPSINSEQSGTSVRWADLYRTRDVSLEKMSLFGNAKKIDSGKNRSAERNQLENIKARAVECLRELELMKLDFLKRCKEKRSLRAEKPVQESRTNKSSSLKDSVMVASPTRQANSPHLEASSSGEGSTLKNEASSRLVKMETQHSAIKSNVPRVEVLAASSLSSPAVEADGVTSRRKLFLPPSPSKQDTSIESQNPTMSYDSFLHQVKPPSCHSTPSKLPATGPSGGVQSEVVQPVNDEKKVMGFTILDEKSPATKLAKKKEQFLLGRVKKEEELRQKQMEREIEAERKKQEAREQQERLLLKKQEEKEKRDKIFKEYQMRKQKEEEAAQHQPGVIGSNAAGPSKQGNRSRTNSRHNVHVESLKHFDTSPTPLGLTVPISSNLSSSRGALHHLKDDDSDSGSSSGAGSEYTGPKLFKQLSAKSNRNLISNALNHCCLSGKVNDGKRSQALQALERSEDHHFMVLFRDHQCQFRGLYSYRIREEKLYKLFGSGPNIIKPWMIDSLFKYNSGRRTFNSVASKTLAISMDAITIKSSLWNHSKK